MDSISFSDRVRAYRIRLYKIAFSMMGSRADAEDAVSEAVIRAWQKRDFLRNEAFFETWLTRILINVCRMELRKRRKFPHQPLDENLSLPVREAPSVDNILLSMDEKYRLPLTMHYALEMSVAETAKALSLPEGVIRWRIRKGKELAVKAFEKEELQ